MRRESLKDTTEKLKAASESALGRLGPQVSSTRLARLRSYAFSICDTLDVHRKAELLTKEEMVAVMAASACFLHEKYFIKRLD